MKLLKALLKIPVAWVGFILLLSLAYLGALCYSVYMMSVLLWKLGRACCGYTERPAE